MSGHFCAVFICDQLKNPKDLKVLAVTDKRFSDVKMPGGMAELVSGGREETPEETMCREAVSETGVQVLKSRLVFQEEVLSRLTKQNHQRYFFLALEVSGLPGDTSAPRTVAETNARDGSVENLSCSWLSIREFAKRLFRGQHRAFGAILADLARSPRFFSEFSDLLEKFPAPDDL